jgi:hypothetical protein
LGILQKEWVKLHSVMSLLVMFGNFTKGVSEATFHDEFACYVWEFYKRSEWSHYSMTIYTKEWAKPFRDEFACYVWVKARHIISCCLGFA